MTLTPHIPWARSIARGLYAEHRVPRRRWVDVSDYESAALIGLWQAAKRWDGRGDFRGWAYRRVTGSVIDEGRRVATKGASRTIEAAISNPAPLTIDGPDSSGDEWLPSDELTPEEHLCAHEDAEEATRLTVSVMGACGTWRDGHVVRGLMKGLTQQEIGDELGVSRSRVCQMLAGVRTEAKRRLAA